MCETQFGCPPTETGRGEGEERNRTPQHNLVAQKKKRLQSALQMLKPVAPTFAGPVRAPGSKSQGGQRGVLRGVTESPRVSKKNKIQIAVGSN